MSTEASPDRLPSWRRALAVVAHPDDESFGLGAVLAGLAEQGAVVDVLCLTHGEASTLHGVAGDLSTVRGQELAAAAELLGLRSATLRGYADGAVGQADPDRLTAEVLRAAGHPGPDAPEARHQDDAAGHPGPDAPEARHQDDAAGRGRHGTEDPDRDDVDRSDPKDADPSGPLDAGRPDGIVVFDETGITGHPDHRAATAAARRAAAVLDIPVLAWTLPQDVAECLNAETGASFVGQPPERIDLVVAVDRARQRRASLAHASQALPTSVLWRRLELLGPRESLRWL